MTIPDALKEVSEAIIAQSRCSGASMATRKITIALSTVVVVAALSFVAGVYSVGHIGGTLKSGFDATSTDANAQAGEQAS